MRNGHGPDVQQLIKVQTVIYLFIYDKARKLHSFTWINTELEKAQN